MKSTWLGSKFSVVLPLTLAVFMYLLFVIFGNTVDKNKLLIITPLLSCLTFLGIWLVYWLHTIHQGPIWLIKAFEFVGLLIFGIGSVVNSVIYLFRLQDGFSPVICIGLCACSAIAFIHRKQIS